jgi:hypothetical protein
MEFPANPVELPDCQLNWEFIKTHFQTSGATTKPSDPVAGQTWIWNPSGNVFWNFVWSGGKWLFIGGAPYTSGPSGATSNGTNSFANVAGGPSFTATYAGIYAFQFGCYLADISGGVNQAEVSLLQNGSDPGSTYNIYVNVTGLRGSSISGAYEAIGLAGEIFNLAMRSNSVAGASVDRCWIRVIPLTVN